MGSPTSPRPKKARQVKSKVKSMLIIFYDIKGTVHKDFILAGQTVNSEYHCDVLRSLREHESVRRLRLELQNWLLLHDNSPPHISFFTTNNMTVVLHPPYFLLFPRLKIKLKGCHYDTTNLIKAGSQAVLNMHTDHDFQDVFKNGRSAWNGTYACLCYIRQICSIKVCNDAMSSSQK
jgi:hypothetical protein